MPGQARPYPPELRVTALTFLMRSARSTYGTISAFLISEERRPRSREPPSGGPGFRADFRSAEELGVGPSGRIEVRLLI